MINRRYEEAKAMYKQFGVDTDAALKKLNDIQISMHCWQGDDVVGFDGADSLSGGIQTTGNYPGRATNVQELMDDMDEVFSMVPGTHRINLHASYAIFDDEKVDRDKLEPKHFEKWMQYAKKRGIGIDFNPTLFAHPKAVGLTLASPDESIRQFWINHCKACIRISQYFAEELDTYCLMNIWIPDGLKDIPGDRLGPRKRFKQSLDEILSIDYDKEKVIVCLESKVFGIGMESYTVGSSEFTLNYAQQAHIAPLLDNGHYHPTEVVSDKLSSTLLFFDKVALHVTRPVRWDSDHVVLFDDETKEIAKEIVRNDALDRVYIGLDFFDASINRISAWTVGMHNMQKALLHALLMPMDTLRTLQDQEDFTQIMAIQETLKTFPLGDVWNYYLQTHDCPTGFSWYDEVMNYETSELEKRGAHHE
ncbi:L-rhamnose isomerase [Breznakia blatticola]|uniref:L-rhamnose isomerase n=1 Tax=Breznakia blatticola TaxID=1754012 RepID=A0A4V3G954_9FIRM|nr:L-rhamnose isomerase [Breznakia blatticola]TDW25487.1 L-rhamnose isomerase [Breznakia blatticola]